MRAIFGLLSIVAVIIFGIIKIRSREKITFSYKELTALHEEALNKK